MVIAAKTHITMALGFDDGDGDMMKTGRMHLQLIKQVELIGSFEKILRTIPELAPQGLFKAL